MHTTCNILYTQDKDASLWSYFGPWLATNEPDPVAQAACKSMTYSNIVQEYAANWTQYAVCTYGSAIPLCPVRTHEVMYDCVHVLGNEPLAQKRMCCLPCSRLSAWWWDDDSEFKGPDGIVAQGKHFVGAYGRLSHGSHVSVASPMLGSVAIVWEVYGKVRTVD